MKKKFIFALALVMSACDNSAETSKVKNTQETNELIAKFELQEHRIELNGCEMLYNKTSFSLGMKITELIEIFGAYDFFNRGHYVWKKAGIVFLTEERNEDKEHESYGIYIYMNDFANDDHEEPLIRKHKLHKKQDFFLIEGIPLNKNTTIKQFVDHSKLSLNDFGIGDYSYDRVHSCSKGKDIHYTMTTTNNWVYDGGGRIQLKSHINQNNNSLIEDIFISYWDPRYFL